MTLVTLVHGGSAAARDNAIAARVIAGRREVALIEGLSGGSVLDNDKDARPGLTLVRIAPGCPCCTGKLAMRVTLNRLLRDKPQRLYISLANSEHLSGVINFLQEDQYRKRLEIGEPVDCSKADNSPADSGH